MNNRTSRQLVVKCSLDSWNKKITFDSARNCTYELLRRKVEQCYSLSSTSFAITYKDDDGEITTIASDTDLTEAIQYFYAGDDAPLSSAASILSGRSFGSRKVTLKVQITVDYDGPSLSDTSSLISLDEYRGRNGSQQSFSFEYPPLDDDSVTVSSRDNSGPSVSSWSALPDNRISGVGIGSLASSSGSRFTLVSHPSGNRILEGSATLENGASRSGDPFSDKHNVPPSQRLPEDPSAVFERLKLEEELAEDASNVHSNSLARNSRGAAWLKEQNERHVHTMVGVLPEPSVSDDVSFDSQDEDGLSGDLALERDPRGRYYYNYTSAGSSASQVHDSGYDDVSPSGAAPIFQRTRPSSMHLNWLANQQMQTQKARAPEVFLTVPNLRPFHGNLSFSPTHGNSDFIIDRELLQYLPPTVPPEDSLTDCSICGTLLDCIRYVCSTCGEKHPVLSNPTLKGKGKANGSSSFSYPPQPPYIHSISSSPGNSLSSQTHLGGSSESLPSYYKPLPSIPSTPNLATPGVPSLRGFELCSNCLESAGVHHAIEAASSTSPVIPISANGDAQAASQWRRAAPKKGELRHAFLEKCWSHNRWEDVEIDAMILALKHPGVKCAQILLVLDFTVPYVTSWTFARIVSQLASLEILIPQMEVITLHTFSLRIAGSMFTNIHIDGYGCLLFPLQLESASRRAINLWTGGDAASVGLSASWSKASSVVSSYARTVVGNARHAPTPSNDHRLLCKTFDHEPLQDHRWDPIPVC
ncbi:hypothetical protein C0995_014601 [Termitomyces sp. Mi166|nr:hypothetical protein C0995_014601 [Termitomyces sp. Mi166\